MRYMKIYVIGALCVIAIILASVLVIYRNATEPPVWICKNGSLYERQSGNVYVKWDRSCIEVK